MVFKTDYCLMHRMLQRDHSAILSTFTKLSFVLKIFVLSILSGRLRQVLLYYNIGLIYSGIHIKKLALIYSETAKHKAHCV